MKRILLVLLMIVSLGFYGCSQETSTDSTEGTEDQNESAVSEELKTLRIGSDPNVMEVVESMEDSLKEEGYELKVVVFDDSNLPNIALDEGSVDANLHQHKPYMDAYNEANDGDLFFVEPLYASISGLFSDKWDSTDELPDGAKIGIGNDASNTHRYLLQGEDFGLWKLSEAEGEDYLYSVMDVVENPKNFEFVTIDEASINQSIQDLDSIFSVATTVLKAGGDPTSYIAAETDYTEFAIGLVVKEGNKDEEWVDAITRAFKTEETKNNINEVYKGSYHLFD